MPSVACPVLQYFSTPSHKRHDFRKFILEPIKSVLIFPTSFIAAFLILKRNKRDMKNVYWCMINKPINALF
jgi:hypothetical protein